LPRRGLSRKLCPRNSIHKTYHSQWGRNLRRRCYWTAGLRLHCCLVFGQKAGRKITKSEQRQFAGMPGPQKRLHPTDEMPEYVFLLFFGPKNWSDAHYPFHGQLHCLQGEFIFNDMVKRPVPKRVDRDQYILFQASPTGKTRYR
jgi:hypothetical protein